MYARVLSHPPRTEQVYTSHMHVQELQDRLENQNRQYKSRATTFSMPSVDEVRAKLAASLLAPIVLEVVDTSDGCGSKFEVIVVSEKFEGVKLLERQREVNSILADEMPSIHALSMKTWTPAQYEAKQGGK